MQSSSTWTDKEGRSWSAAINVNSVRRARQLVDVNLLDVFDGRLLARLSEDPVLLVNTLYAICKPQADERDLTDEAFGELLVGDTIEHATAALVQGLIDFFPKDRRTVLARLWRTTTKAQNEAVNLAVSKLDSPLVEKAMQGAIRRASDDIDQALKRFGETSSSLPASSESTPVA